MTTVVSVAQGGTGSNSAALARTALGVPPSAAYDQANTARDQANTARTQANTGYDQANTARGQANTAYAQANAAYGQANTAYAQANSAYGAANTRLSASGGTLSGDLIITGNLTVSGNSTTLNTEILTVEDADVVLLSNVASTPALNAGIIVNRGTSTNTFIRWAENIDEWGWSDNGTTTYFFEDLRQGLITTNTTFGTVNTNITNTNSNAINAYAQANSAFAAANNRVLKAGDTMTGQLNISSGGLLVTGNVGVGIASPTKRLHILGSAIISDGATPANNATLLVQDDGVANTVTSSATFRVANDGSSGSFAVFEASSGVSNTVITNAGNMGIGTTNPATTLHVNASGGGIVRVSRLGTGAGIMQMEADGTDGALSTTNNLRFQTASTERMRITLSGDLLVGATNADIGGSVPGIKLMGATGKILASTNTASGLFYDEPIYADRMDASGDGVCIALARNGFYKAGIGVIRGASASAQGSITIYTATNSGFNERMRIDSSGNVGIGTTAPYSSLHLAGDLTMGSGSNARPALKITNWGYSASYRALLIGSSNTTYTTANTGAVTVCFNYDPSANPNGSFSGDGREIIFRRGTRFVTPNSADNAFNLTNLVLYDGNVGIGTDTPQVRLDLGTQGGTVIKFNPGTAVSSLPYSGFAHNDLLIGGIYASSYPHHQISFGHTADALRKFSIGSANDANFNASTVFVPAVTITSGGSVGINTASPTSKLHIAGNTQIYSGTTGYSPPLIFGSETGDAKKAIFMENYWMVYQGHDNEGHKFRSVNAGGSFTDDMTISGAGAVTIPGSLSKGSGSFKIDHPLPEKSNTHFLVHSFIEGPQADLIYRGRANLINGIATVNIDTAAGMTEGTFVLLCRDVQCFTSNETDWDNVRGSVSNNILTIECQNASSNATIAWMVIGERQDKHMYDTEWTDEIGKVIVEPEKPAIITPEEPNVS